MKERVDKYEKVFAFHLCPCPHGTLTQRSVNLHKITDKFYMFIFLS